MDNWGLQLNVSNAKAHSATSSASNSVRSTGLTLTYKMGDIVIGATQQKNDDGDQKTTGALIGFSSSLHNGSDSLSCMTNLFSKVSKSGNSGTDGSGEFDKSYCTYMHSFGGAAAAK